MAGVSIHLRPGRAFGLADAMILVAATVGRWGGIGLLILGIAGCQGAIGDNDPARRDGLVQLSAKPTRESYQLGEPIRILLHIENPGEKDLSIDLGTSDVDRLSVIWTPADNGKAIERQGSPVAGITFPHVIKVAAGGTATHEFLLNKLLIPDRPGTFKLRIQIRGTELQEAITTVNLLIPLREHLRDWYALAISRRGTESLRAIEDIIYTRAPEAIPYQMRLLDGGFVDPRETPVLLQSMLAGSKDDAAVRPLVERLGKASGPLRAMIFRALRSHGWDNFNDASRKLLGPYKSEIMNAAPTVISDGISPTSANPVTPDGP